MKIGKEKVLPLAEVVGTLTVLKYSRRSKLLICYLLPTRSMTGLGSNFEVVG